MPFVLSTKKINAVVLEKKYFEDIDEKCVVLGKMIGSLIKVRKAGRANRGS
jgi:hypothetical protein